MKLAVAALLLVLPLCVGAADIQKVVVERDGDVYSMQSEVRFEATLEQLYDVLVDWDLSTQFSSVVVESRNVEPDELGRPQFYIRNEACIMFFCKSFERAGYVETEPYVSIRAYADPERSDFHISNESWRFVDDKDGAIVIYNLEFDPKFWVPPVIGPYLIKRKLKKDGPEALIRIDRIAQQHE